MAWAPSLGHSPGLPSFLGSAFRGVTKDQLDQSHYLSNAKVGAKGSVSRCGRGSLGDSKPSLTTARW